MMKKIDPARLLEILATANPKFNVHLEYSERQHLKVWISDTPYYVYMLEAENPEVLEQHYQAVCEVLSQIESGECDE
jgi:hypothetical protein